MQKIICNVYKDFAYWKKPPPGIGDYIRGCAYLLHLENGIYKDQFSARVNLSLAPLTGKLNRNALWLDDDRANLASAREFFLPERDGDVRTAIEEFINSDHRIMLISTNKSWRGVDDTPSRNILTQLRSIFDCDDRFDPSSSILKRSFTDGYHLLHLRDEDRTSQHCEFFSEFDQYRKRVNNILDSDRFLSLKWLPEQTICVSNNVILRSEICDSRRFINAETIVQNLGFRGIFGDGELVNMLMIRDAKSVFSVTPFSWNSGFCVWASRIFDVPAVFINGTTEFSGGTADSTASVSN